MTLPITTIYECYYTTDFRKKKKRYHSGQLYVESKHILLPLSPHETGISTIVVLCEETFASLTTNPTRPKETLTTTKVSVHSPLSTHTHWHELLEVEESIFINMNIYSIEITNCLLTNYSSVQMIKEKQNTIHEKVSNNISHFFKNLLLPHQIEGAKFMQKSLNKYNGVLVCDAVGLGKTLMTIAVTHSLINSKYKVIILTPKSLCFNWKNEILKKVGYDRFPFYQEEITGQTIDDWMKLKLNHLILSFESFIKYFQIINTGNDQFILIIDEAHRLKNGDSTNLWKCLTSEEFNKRVCFKILITATPISVDPKRELKALSQYTLNSTPVNEESNDYILCRKNSIIDRNVYQVDIFIKNRNINQLESIDAPPLVQIQKARQLTSRLFEEKRQEESTTSSFVTPKISLPTKSTFLQKALKRDDPIISQIPTPVKRRKISTPELSMKGSVLFNLLSNFPEEDSVIIVSNFIDPIKDFYNFWSINHPSSYIDGSVRDLDRENEINKFQNLKSSKYLFMTSRAGGLGLNLFIARHLILIDIDWNPSIYDQLIGRINRFGQVNSSIFIYNLIYESSIDYFMSISILKNKWLFNQKSMEFVVNGKSDCNDSKQSDEDNCISEKNDVQKVNYSVNDIINGKIDYICNTVDVADFDFLTCISTFEGVSKYTVNL